MSEVSAPTQAQDDALSPPTFDVLPLSSETRETLAKMGYTSPTPVQRAVFEPASRGKDLVVQARTGTGKTAAFGLPIIEHLVRRSEPAVQALCLCPTRELAIQVANEIGRLGEGRNIKPIAVYGGAPMGRQIEALREGAQVVVGTPGRVLDHIRRGTLKPNTVRALILDEADEMLSMGFERELTAILNSLPKERQTLLFSATLPPDIERMARERLKQPEFITLSSDAVGALSISHFVYFVLEDKIGALFKVLEAENPDSAIVFCNMKADTESVAAALTKGGYDADWLNGDLPQDEREAVVTRIRNGTLRFLVATDVAARGIDISHLTHVINYDFPDNTESYVHRTGRTGRAGRTGTAISLVRPQDIGSLYFLRLAYKIKPFERFLPTAGELKTRRETDLINALIEAFAGKEQHPDDIQLARRLLSHDRAESIVAHLLRERLGERVVAETSAAQARRAKNPQPPAPEAAASSEAPLPELDRSRGRDDRGRGRDDRGRGRDDRGRGPSRDFGDRDRGPSRDFGDRGPSRDRGPGRDAGRDRPAGDRPAGDRPYNDRGRDDRGPGRDRDRAPRAPEFVTSDAPAPEVVAPEAASVGPAPADHGAPTTPPPAAVQAVVAVEAPVAEAAPVEQAPVAQAPAPRPPVSRAPAPQPPVSRAPAPRAPVAPAAAPAAPPAAPAPVATEAPVAAPQAPAAPAAQAAALAGPDFASEAPTSRLPQDDRRRGRERNDRDRSQRRGRGPRNEFEQDDLAVRYTVSDADPVAVERAMAGVSPEAASVPAPLSAPAATPRPPVAQVERPSDLANWHPPEEDNDDQPIWGAGGRSAPPPEVIEDDGALNEDLDFALIFVDVGRREGVRPSDLQRALRDRAGIGRRDTGRIRVRDRHSLVAVKRELLTRAVEGLAGAELGGRVVRAEPARERGPENE